jgi:hypothetical protein
MNTMNFKKIFWIMFITSVILVWGCRDEETGKPQIVLTELGHNNSKVAYTGSDLHVDAEIVADGKIDNILIEIHQEGDHSVAKSAEWTAFPAWDFDSVYTEKYSGALNTDFHEDILIPLDADTGMYHIHIRVEDQEGNQESVEDEFRIDYGKK